MKTINTDAFSVDSFMFSDSSDHLDNFWDDDFLDSVDDDAEAFAHEQGFDNYTEFAEYERQMNLLSF